MYIIYNRAENKPQDSPSSSPKDPIRLNFNVSSEVKDMIKAAKQNLDK